MVEQEVRLLGSRSYRPGGGFRSAGLLEGHVEGVCPGVVRVGRDGGRRRHGVEGRAGLGVGRWRRHVVLCVVVVVGAGGGGAAVLDVLIHAVQQPQVGVL